MIDTSNPNMCDFLTNDGMIFKCKNCGTELKFSEYQLSSPVFVCSMSIKKQKDETFLSFIGKIKNFAMATIDHVRLGMPTCTDDTIEKRYEICTKCEYFDNSSCKLCGCGLHRNRRFVSKLAWSDQKCPINKW